MMGEDDEMLEVLNDRFARVGALSRGQVHRTGAWHRTFHCWVAATSGEPEIVVQERSTAKAVYPGVFDISVAGHLLDGELPIDGVREIREELGFSVAPEHLLHLGDRLDVWSYGGNVIDRELCSMFLVVLPADQLHRCRLDDQEVSRLLLCPLAGLIDMFAGMAQVSEGRVIAGDPAGLDAVTLEHFLPHSPGYYLSSLLAVEDALHGRPVVSV